MVERGSKRLAQRVVTGGVSRSGCHATLGSQIGQRPGQKRRGAQREPGVQSRKGLYVHHGM